MASQEIQLSRYRLGTRDTGSPVNGSKVARAILGHKFSLVAANDTLVDSPINRDRVAGECRPNQLVSTNSQIWSSLLSNPHSLSESTVLVMTP